MLVTSFSGPDDGHVVPLAVGDWDVGRELEENRRVLRIVLEQVDVDAGIDSLDQDSAVRRVKFGTEIVRFNEIEKLD